jgi:hypothetical protein
MTKLTFKLGRLGRLGRTLPYFCNKYSGKVAGTVVGTHLALVGRLGRLGRPMGDSALFLFAPKGWDGWDGWDGKNPKNTNNKNNVGTVGTVGTVKTFKNVIEFFKNGTAGTAAFLQTRFFLIGFYVQLGRLGRLGRYMCRVPPFIIFI